MGRRRLLAFLGIGIGFVLLARLVAQAPLAPPPLPDPAALAAALARLAGDGALRKRLGTAARARTERLFSADAVGRQTVELYHRILAGDTAAVPLAAGLVR